MVGCGRGRPHMRTRRARRSHSPRGRHPGRLRRVVSQSRVMSDGGGLAACTSAFSRARGAANGMAGAFERCADAMTETLHTAYRLDGGIALGLGVWDLLEFVRLDGGGCRGYLCRNRSASVVAPTVGGRAVFLCTISSASAVGAVRALNAMIDGCNPFALSGTRDPLNKNMRRLMESPPKAVS